MTIVIKEIHLHMIILISFLLKISLSFSFHYFPLSIDHPCPAHPCPIKEVLSPITLNSLLAASNYPKLRLPDAALYPLFLFDENDDDDGNDGVSYKLFSEDFLRSAFSLFNFQKLFFLLLDLDSRCGLRSSLVDD